MNFPVFFFLATNEEETDPMSSNHHSNRIQRRTQPSEKQTLKIEEVFTSSTRHSGTLKSFFFFKKVIYLFLGMKDTGD